MKLLPPLHDVLLSVGSLPVRGRAGQADSGKSIPSATRGGVFQCLLLFAGDVVALAIGS